MLSKLGHEQIDKQHDGLTEIIRKIEELVVKRTEDRTIIKLVELLITETLKHYKYEEALMDSIDYPNRFEHTQDHQSAISEMYEIKDRLEQEIDAHQTLYSQFVSKFLPRIHDHDRDLVDHLKRFVLQSSQEGEKP